MFLNKNNFNYLVIDYQKFNINNIYFEFDENKDFININYKDILNLEGLYLKSPLIRPINTVKLVDDNAVVKKYTLEIPLNDTNIFHNIFDNLDTYIREYFKNNTYKKMEKYKYVQNIKYSNINNVYKFKNIRIKINMNHTQIFYNDKKYTDDLITIDFNQVSIKCYISSHGCWKFNSNYGMTWRCIKLYIYDNINNENNLNYYIDNNLIQKIDENVNKNYINYNIFKKNQEDIQRNTLNNQNHILEPNSDTSSEDEETLIKIPNFEFDYDF